MKRNIAIWILGIAALLSSVAVVAQSISSRSSGSGTVVWNGKNQKLRYVSVSLRRNGDFDITFTGDRTITVGGTWTSNSNNRYSLKYDEVNGQRASGNGTVTTDRRDKVETVYLNGSVGRDGFSIDFSTTRPDSNNDRTSNRPSNRPNNRPNNRPDDDDQFRSFRDSRQGNGALDYDRRVKDLNHVTVDLKRDGSFDISFTGDTRFRARGTWTWSGNDISLRVDDALGDKNATGRGTLFITRDRSSFWKIELNGRANGRSYKIGFSD